MPSDSENVARHDEGCITAPNQQITLFKSMLALESHFDFALYGTPPDGKSTNTLKPVRTLKVALAAGSKYFCALFANNNFRDSRSNEHTSKMFSHECIAAVVELLHTGNVHSKSLKFAIELRKAIQFYLMDDLVSACEAYLVNNLKADNCVDLWKVACEDSSLSTLTVEIEKYIAKNLSKIIIENSFLSLKEEEFCKLLLIKSIVTSASADICLQTAMAWLESDPSKRKISSDAVLNSISLSPGVISRKELINACRSKALSEAANRKMLDLSTNQLDLGDVYEFIPVPDYVEPSGNSSSSSETETLYCVGGYEEQYRKQFLQYNVNRMEWIEMDPLPLDRKYCSAGFCDGMLWVGGGLKIDALTADVDGFNLSSSTWTANKIATLPRQASWNACGSQQTVYLSNDEGEFITYSAQTKEIVAKKTMPCKRIWHTASYSAILNSVFVADGRSSSSGSAAKYYRRIDKYDIASDTWQSVGFAKIECSQRASTLCGDELYLMGGCDGTTQFALKKVEVCNVRTGKTWSIPDLPHIRNLSRAVLLYNNVICVFGSIMQYTKSVDAYDVREGKWTTGAIVPDMPVASGGFGLAWK